MSEKHKTERPRRWQAASPSARCSALSLSSRPQQLSISCLHGEDCSHRPQRLRAPGRPVRARGSGKTQSSKDTRQQLRAACRDDRCPQVPREGNPQRLLERPFIESWHTKCHILPILLSCPLFFTTGSRIRSVNNSVIPLCLYL